MTVSVVVLSCRVSAASVPKSTALAARIVFVSESSQEEGDRADHLYSPSSVSLPALEGLSPRPGGGQAMMGRRRWRTRLSALFAASFLCVPRDISTCTMYLHARTAVTALFCSPTFLAITSISRHCLIVRLPIQFQMHLDPPRSRSPSAQETRPARVCGRRCRRGKRLTRMGGCTPLAATSAVSALPLHIPATGTYSLSASSLVCS
ncbi:hypothetical protein C8R45DRAFT_571655 [Mycena sanguinolenta]|nr:hypothetical protein C8R45DRAFT_571655 [Mycena sanguinolenta]